MWVDQVQFWFIFTEADRSWLIVSRISLTRPQLAEQVEDLLVRMGQQGQIKGQVSDEALKGLLAQVRRVTDMLGLSRDLRRA